MLHNRTIPYFDVRQGTRLSLHMAVDQGGCTCINPCYFKVNRATGCWLPILVDTQYSQIAISLDHWRKQCFGRPPFAEHAVVGHFNFIIVSGHYQQNETFQPMATCITSKWYFRERPPEAAVWPLQRRHPQALHGSWGRLWWTEWWVSVTP